MPTERPGFASYPSSEHSGRPPLLRRLQKDELCIWFTLMTLVIRR